MPELMNTNGKPLVLNTDTEANYGALSTGALQTYIKVQNSFDRSSSHAYGTPKQGGGGGNYVSGQVSGIQQCGVQAVFGHEAGGDYNYWYDPNGGSDWSQQYDLTMGDTVVPPGDNSVNPPPTLGGELVLEFPFQSLDLHQRSSSIWTGEDGSQSVNNAAADLNLWHSATILGIRDADGVVKPIRTLNESDGFSLHTTSDSSFSSPATGDFNFTHTSFDATGYESNTSGPIRDGGMAHALDSTFTSLEHGANDPMGVALDFMHHGSVGAFGAGSSSSVPEIVMAHAGIGGFGGKG